MKIGVDPGHGNSNRRSGVYDPGAVSAGHAEADIVLQWGLTGKWIAEKEFGIKVFMTRDDDSDPTPVSTRDDRAEQAGCDYFLSLHCNAASGQATGTETFYRDIKDKVFAALVQNAALSALEIRDRGLKTEADSQHPNGLSIFNFDGPAALLELGFIDNPADRARMRDRDRRITFWRALFTSLKARTEL